MKQENKEAWSTWFDEYVKVLMEIPELKNATTKDESLAFNASRR